MWAGGERGRQGHRHTHRGKVIRTSVGERTCARCTGKLSVWKGSIHKGCLGMGCLVSRCVCKQQTCRRMSMVKRACMCERPCNGVWVCGCAGNGFQGERQGLSIERSRV